ncbi:SsgA family sporulation/cell division regulator [Streptomyces olivaceoviridis]
MDQRREHAARPVERTPLDSPSGTVRHDVRVWLVPAGTLRIPVRARFAYDRTDPLAVRISFSLPPQRQVTWFFARPPAGPHASP